jgi:hypothetical protein
MKKQTFLIHVDMGEVGRCIKATSKEEAIRIATDWATRIVTKKTCSHIQPRVIRVEGEPYEAPPLRVKLAEERTV